MIHAQHLQKMVSLNVSHLVPVPHSAAQGLVVATYAAIQGLQAVGSHISVHSVQVTPVVTSTSSASIGASTQQAQPLPPAPSAT
jgi:hypothetical protein